MKKFAIQKERTKEICGTASVEKNNFLSQILTNATNYLTYVLFYGACKV